MVNKELFIKAMKNNNDSIVAISKDLKISRQSVYYRIDNGFNSTEVEFLKKRWNLTPIGVDKIFFGGEK